MASEMDKAIELCRQRETYVNGDLTYTVTEYVDDQRPKWRTWVIVFADGYRLVTRDPAVMCRLNARGE